MAGYFSRTSAVGDPGHTDLYSYGAEFDVLQLENNERTTRYKQYRDEQELVRDPDLQLYTNDLTDYGKRPATVGPQRHRITLPLGLALTVKHTFRISGQLPDVIVDQRDESDEERYRSDTMEKVIWAILRGSGGETTLGAGAWDGSQVGATAFDLYFNVDKQMPQYRVIDPGGVFPVLGVDDPHDFHRVYRTWLAPIRSVELDYKDKLFRGEPVKIGDLTASDLAHGIQWVQLVQMCDREKRVVFAHGRESCVGLSEYQHDYGFVPTVIIPNIGPYNKVFGWADFEFIRALQHYMSALFSREADVIRNVANGAMLETNTGQDPSAIRKALDTGGIIPSKREGKLEPIDAPEMPNFEALHSDRGMEFFKMLGFAPDAAWGKPGSASGTDRGMQLQPLMEYTAMKQQNWSQGLQRLFGYALRLVETQMVSTTKYRGSKGSRGGRTKPFSLILGPNLDATQMPIGKQDELTGELMTLSLPRNPKELFDGEYDARFVWHNRIDPNDPAFVTSELSKFTQGAQSLETTLENLGVEAPEDEMRRIEKEADRFPWINSGMVALLRAQLSGGAQGDGGGPANDPAANNMDAAAMMQQPGGDALAADAGMAALGQTAPGGPLYGGA